MTIWSGGGVVSMVLACALVTVSSVTAGSALSLRVFRGVFLGVFTAI